MTASLLATAPLAAESELYRWTDDDGEVHYSDTLPADKAPSARDIYDRAGRHLESIDAALSEEERALKRQREQQEHEAEELRRKEAEAQAEYDRMLQQTYTSTEGVRQARDDRLANLESTTNLARSRIARYEEELEQLRDEAAQLERASDGNPEPVHDRIEEIRGRIERQQAFIDRREADMAEVRDTFEGHIQRFQELQEDN